MGDGRSMFQFEFPLKKRSHFHVRSISLHSVFAYGIVYLYVCGTKGAQSAMKLIFGVVVALSGEV